MDNLSDELKRIISNNPELAALDLLLVNNKLIKISVDQQRFLEVKSKLHDGLLNIYFMFYNNKKGNSQSFVSDALLQGVKMIDSTVEFKVFIQEFGKKDDYNSLMTDVVEYDLTKAKIEEIQSKIKEYNKKIFDSSFNIKEVILKDVEDEYKDLIEFYYSDEKDEILKMISQKILKKIKSSYISELIENLNRLINYLSHKDWEMTIEPINNHYEKFDISSGMELFCIKLPAKISNKSKKKLEQTINDYVKTLK